MKIALLIPSVAALFFSSIPIEAAAGGKPPTYNLYFGDFHGHTRFSDGWEGTPEDAYITAREGGADFYGTSDHNFMLTQDEWAETLRMADEQTGRWFAALPASEYWIASGFGEIIVLNRGELRNKANFHDENKALSRAEVIPAFYDWLAAQPDVLGHWVHPGIYGDLDEFDHWNEVRDQAMNSIEIHNYGSWLGAPANWGVYDYEPQYIMALEKGWHIMPAAGSDTHSPDWIVGSSVRTVLLAERLSSEDLYAAMRAHRGYATLDSNLRIRYRLNGEVMGSILAEAGGSYTAEIQVEDPDGVAEDAITLIELISDHGEVVASRSGDDTAVDWTVTLESDTARYYYLRVTTASGLDGSEGVTAWTAPVWTGR